MVHVLRFRVKGILDTKASIISQHENFNHDE